MSLLKVELQFDELTSVWPYLKQGIDRSKVSNIS